MQHQGLYPKSVLLAASLALIIGIFGCAQVATADTQVSGAVGGVWGADESPFIVTGNLSLADGDTLEIEPGVEVRFEGRFGFDVSGTLLAVGTVQDSIRFVSSSGRANDWRSIKISGRSARNSRMQYCIIRHAYRGVEVATSSILVENSEISIHDNAAVRMDGSTVAIRNCVISTIGGNGVAIVGTSGASRAEVTGCHISGCGARGIGVGDNSQASLEGNYIEDIVENGIDIRSAGACTVADNVVIRGQQMGIYVELSHNCSLARNVVFRADQEGIKIHRCENADVINNTVYDCGGIGVFYYSSTGQLLNTLVALSGSEGVFLQASNPSLQYNDSWGNSSDDYSGVAPDETNLSVDPLLADPSGGDFHPQQDSPLVDACPVPYTDPDGTLADIGAWFYNQNIPPTIVSFSPDDLDTLKGGGLMRFSVSAVDSNLHQLFYYWYLNGVQVDGDTVYEHEFVEDGNYLVRVVVDDRFYLGKSNHVWEFTVQGAAVRQDDDANRPLEFRLSDPYPNPFNSSTSVVLELARRGRVSVELFDLQGHRVGRLLDEMMNQGRYRLPVAGGSLPAGVYVIRAETGGTGVEKKLLLLK